MIEFFEDIAPKISTHIFSNILGSSGKYSVSVPFASDKTLNIILCSKLVFLSQISQEVQIPWVVEGV